MCHSLIQVTYYFAHVTYVHICTCTLQNTPTEYINPKVTKNGIRRTAEVKKLFDMYSG